MSVKPVYKFDYVTYSDDAVPEALQGSTYWYDTGTKNSAESVYYDTSDTYAYWFTGAAAVVTVIADVGGATTDGFVQSGDTATGFGAWTGTLTINEHSISDAWYRAETTAFESLAAFVGSQEGRACFRGFLPVQGDAEEDMYVNVWQMSSGNSGEFEMSRLWGADANWCSLRADAKIESTWETREKAMNFAGAVIAWLKSTSNLNGVGNVTWCTLSDIPAEPEIYRTDGKMNRQRYWRQTIELELVYKTESEYG